LLQNDQFKKVVLSYFAARQLEVATKWYVDRPIDTFGRCSIAMKTLLRVYCMSVYA